MTLKKLFKVVKQNDKRYPPMLYIARRDSFRLAILLQKNKKIIQKIGAKRNET